MDSTLSIFDLYDAKQYPVDTHDDIRSKSITLVHRKRRVHVPSGADALWKVKPSAQLDQESDGVHVVQTLQSHAMIKLSDTSLRKHINDLGMDVRLLSSDKAKHSARGFIECWHEAVAQYCDLSHNKSVWNVCLGRDVSTANKTEKELELDRVCGETTLLTTQAIARDEELSMCFGLEHWLKQCTMFATSRNLLGVCIVLQSHILRDPSLAKRTHKSRLDALRDIAQACDKLLASYLPTGRASLGNIFTSDDLEQYDAAFPPLDELPAESVANQLPLPYD